MKNFFIKAALFMVMPLMAASFVACDDDDDVAGPAFQSELVGKYVPAYENYKLPAANEAMDYSFIIDYKFNDGFDQNLPENMIGGFLNLDTALGLVQNLVAPLVKGGLVELELTDAGKIGAKAHELIVEIPENATQEQMTSAILGAIMEPKFMPETTVFPSAETQAIHDALGYYTENGKLYLTIQKSFLTAMGQQMEMDLVALIDTLNTQINLGLVSTPEYFALGVKYAKNGNKLTVKIDREMMLPIVTNPMVKAMLAQVPPIMGMIKLDATVDLIFNNTNKMDFKLLLEKK